jgi:hypothetical protein
MIQNGSIISREETICSSLLEQYTYFLLSNLVGIIVHVTITAVATAQSHDLANSMVLLDAETGVQISSDSVVRPLHMLFHRSLYRNQSA